MARTFIESSSTFYIFFRRRRRRLHVDGRRVVFFFDDDARDSTSTTSRCFFNDVVYYIVIVSFQANNFWATVCKTVRPMLSVRCLSCLSVLSVTFVHCGQTVGRIKMKFGVQVGLGPGHIVLGGDPAPHPLKGHSPPPIFGPYLLRPNGCMDQDVTWYGSRPRPRLLVLDGEPAPPSQKGGQSPPNFRPMFIVPKLLDGSRCHLVGR